MNNQALKNVTKSCNTTMAKVYIGSAVVAAFVYLIFHIIELFKVDIPILAKYIVFPLMFIAWMFAVSGLFRLK